jgi:hypothetical protein
MLAKMRDFLRAGWGGIFSARLIGLRELLPHQKVQATWVRLVESYAAVPEVYREFFEPLQSHAGGRAFPYTVLAPSFEGFVHSSSEKLIVDLDRAVHVLERKGDTFEAQSYPYEGVDCIEVRSMLLDAHIRITGRTEQGPAASVTIRFNSVTDYLFTPILKNIRPAPAGPGDASRGADRDFFDRWLSLNFKFMNYARRSLLDGDRVLHAMLQPEIRATVFTFLGWTYSRAVSPTHACILTGRELILIREEQKQNRQDKYGGIWEYIPLKRIVSLSVRASEAGLLALVVELPHGVRFESIFQAAAQPDLDQLLARFGEVN